MINQFIYIYILAVCCDLWNTEIVVLQIFPVFVPTFCREAVLLTISPLNSLVSSNYNLCVPNLITIASAICTSDGSCLLTCAFCLGFVWLHAWDRRWNPLHLVLRIQARIPIVAPNYLVWECLILIVSLAPWLASYHLQIKYGTFVLYFGMSSF